MNNGQLCKELEQCENDKRFILSGLMVNASRRKNECNQYIDSVCKAMVGNYMRCRVGVN